MRPVASKSCPPHQAEMGEDGSPTEIKVDGRLKALDLLARNLGRLKHEVSVPGAHGV